MQIYLDPCDMSNVQMRHNFLFKSSYWCVYYFLFLEILKYMEY